MLEHEGELINDIRNIGVVFELDGHNALAEQVRQLGDQVERMAKDNASLSASARESLLNGMAVAVNATVDTSLLTTKQRNVMCARLAFVREIERRTATGVFKGVVMDNLIESSLRGELPPHLAPLVGMANARSGGKRGLSKRSLERWCGDFAKGGEGALAPERPGKDLTLPPWATDFLAVYQRPSNPTLADAYRQVFGLPNRQKPGAPSIFAVRRFVKKLSVPAMEKGKKIVGSGSFQDGMGEGQ